MIADHVAFCSVAARVGSMGSLKGPFANQGPILKVTLLAWSGEVVSISITRIDKPQLSLLLAYLLSPTGLPNRYQLLSVRSDLRDGGTHLVSTHPSQPGRP